jgi:hypothetical protein
MRTGRCLTSRDSERESDVKGLGFIAAVAALAFAAAVFGPAALGGKARGHDARRAVSPAQLRGVNFVEVCRYGHMAMDDPIVFPGKPGASHMHTFVGNTTTSAFSTYGTLRAGGTTCVRTDDTAAYWVPALYQGSSTILPVAATVYYRRSTLAQVRPFPNDLRMIAGSSMSTTPQDKRVTYWNCGVEGGVPASSDVPTCPDRPGAFLRLHVRFPSCWDGRNLDSADHKSHMAYPTAKRCPASHPVAVPAIEQIYRYPTRGGDAFSLASGSVYSAHADFVNSWRPPALRRLVNGCLNALVHCGRDD